MSEIALISARKARLESEARAGNKNAQKALDLANSPTTFLSTVQIGITLIGLLTGMYSGEKMTAMLQRFLEQFDFIAKYAGTLSTALILIVITYLSLVIGELVPKRIGMSKAEGISKLVAGPMKIISSLAKPFIVMLSWSSDAIIKLIGLKPSNNTITEEEVKSLISEGTSGGVFEEIEKEIVTNVFHLGDRKIASLMTPRQEVVWLDVNKSIDEIRKIIIDTKYSIYPLCKDSLDNVIGLIYTKDLFDIRMEQGRVDNLASLAKEPVYLPESNRAYQALEKFRETRIHFGIIVDEYGSVIGVSTVYDIVYALLGDISDDEDEKDIVERSDGSFLIDGQIPFDEFLNHFEITLSNSEKKELVGFNTLGGFILHVLEDIPETGEKIDWKGYCLEVVDMDKSRIDKILITPVLQEETED